MSRTITLITEGCGARRWFLQRFQIGFEVLLRSPKGASRAAAVLFP
jgi:hypothetical protein